MDNSLDFYEFLGPVHGEDMLPAGSVSVHMDKYQNSWP